MDKVGKKSIWSKDISLLIICLLGVACANYYFASSMALYAKMISGSVAYAGIITAAFYFGSVGMRFVNGLLVQKYGSHILMLISSALCAAICFLHNFAGVIAVLVVLRLVHGIGYSVFSTASGTAASYMVPNERLGEGMGYYAIGNVLAMAVGPSIALTIVSDGSLSRFHILFNVAAAICLMAFILVFFIKCDGKEESHGDRQKDEKNLPKSFLGFEKGVIIPSLISFMLTFAYSPAIVYLSVYGVSKGWTNIGMAFTMYAAGLLSSRLFTGRLGDKYGPNCIMIPAYCLGTAALALIAFSTAAWQLMAAMFILGLCVGGYNPQINVFCIKRCSDARRGTATAAFNGAGDLGLALGSAIAGLFISHFGYRFTFLNGAALCLVTMAVYIFTLGKDAICRR